jgi:hypothetical protein
MAQTVESVEKVKFKRRNGKPQSKIPLLMYVCGRKILFWDIFCTEVGFFSLALDLFNRFVGQLREKHKSI